MKTLASSLTHLALVHLAIATEPVVLENGSFQGAHNINVEMASESKPVPISLHDHQPDYVPDFAPEELCYNEITQSVEKCSEAVQVSYHEHNENQDREHDEDDAAYHEMASESKPVPISLHDHQPNFVPVAMCYNETTQSVEKCGDEIYVSYPDAHENEHNDDAAYYDILERFIEKFLSDHEEVKRQEEIFDALSLEEKKQAAERMKPLVENDSHFPPYKMESVLKSNEFKQCFIDCTGTTNQNNKMSIPEQQKQQPDSGSLQDFLDGITNVLPAEVASVFESMEYNNQCVIECMSLFQDEKFYDQVAEFFFKVADPNGWKSSEEVFATKTLEEKRKYAHRFVFQMLDFELCNIGNAQDSQPLMSNQMSDTADVPLPTNGLVSHYNSDKRLKKDIKPIANALDTIKKLEGVTYHWRVAEFPEEDFDDKSHIGFIAQDLEDVLPDTVNTEDDGYLSVDYHEFTALLAEGIKELEEERVAFEEETNAEIRNLKILAGAAGAVALTFGVVLLISI